MLMDSVVEIIGERGWRDWLPQDKGEKSLFWIGVVGLLLSLFTLIYGAFDAGLLDQPIVAQLSTTSGVRQRHARSLIWRTFKGGDVYLRDMIFTPETGNAKLRFPNGTQVMLPPGSLVQIDDWEKDGFTILLSEEAALTLPPPPFAQFPDIDDPYPLILMQQEFDAALADRLAEKPALQPLHPFEYKKLYAPTRLVDFEMGVSNPVTRAYNLAKNRWIPTTWTPIQLPGVKYDVQLSNDRNFKRYLSRPTTENKLLVQFEATGHYFLRIEATRGDEISYSNIIPFEFIKEEVKKK